VEVSQLIDEVDRISTSAQFNRLKMFTGAYARGSRTGSMFFHVGPNSNQRIRVYIATISSKSLNMTEADGTKRTISTIGKANTMIGYVDTALDRLNRQRADLGAYFNRMENTIRSLTRSYENMMAADARVRDVDMAAEMVEFTKDKILIQTGTSMLAQANFKPQLVMKLLD
jgi:flagellin